MKIINRQYFLTFAVMALLLVLFPFLVFADVNIKDQIAQLKSPDPTIQKKDLYVLLKESGRRASELNKLLMPVEQIQTLPQSKRESVEKLESELLMVQDGLDVALQENPLFYSYIEEAFDDPDWQVRLGAVSVLHDMIQFFKKRESIPLLISKLDDSSDEVKEAAILALKGPTDAQYKTGKDFKGDKALWQQWWQEHQGEY